MAPARPLLPPSLVARYIPTSMVGDSLAIQENFNILIKVFQ
jgi:hypothetical protein